MISLPTGIIIGWDSDTAGKTHERCSVPLCDASFRFSQDSRWALGWLTRESHDTRSQFSQLKLSTAAEERIQSNRLSLLQPLGLSAFPAFSQPRALHSLHRASAHDPDPSRPLHQISLGLFGCKSPLFHICSIHTPFSVARFVISGSYYHSSFEYVIKSIVRLQLHNKAPDLTSHNT